MHYLVAVYSKSFKRGITFSAFLSQTYKQRVVEIDHNPTKKELKQLVEKHFKTHNPSEKLGEIKYYFLTDKKNAFSENELYGGSIFYKLDTNGNIIKKGK